MADEIKRTIKDVGDTIKEGVHRGNAQTEHASRTVAGDVMTPGEKAGSVAREVTEDTKAEIDKTKRSVRDTL